jgi:hypothetical protein
MPRTIRSSQRTLKLTASPQKIISDQSAVPPGIVVMPMVVLDKPEKIKRK